MANPIKAVYRWLLRPVYARLEHLEAQFESQIRKPPIPRRSVAIEDINDYLTGAQVEGDYLEFGVYIGTTFIHACHHMSYVFPKMRFFAFDSFQGLPKPKGLDAVNGYTSNFSESLFSCGEEQFLKNVEDAGVDMSKVTTVKGWFDQTCTSATAAKYGIGKVAAAWIDGDLYESAVPVLKFLTGRLSTGSVVIFDDWKCFRNDPNFGEQRACREWLAENPHITLRELFSFGSHGVAFSVHISESPALATGAARPDQLIIDAQTPGSALPASETSGSQLTQR